MEQFRFRKWKVYQDSQKLFSEILVVVATLPSQYKYSLGDQITRAGLRKSWEEPDNQDNKYHKYNIFHTRSFFFTI